ncbi:MAG: AAA family ATPase [Terracidiphilus sp.]|jgi:predicted ATPase
MAVDPSNAHHLDPGITRIAVTGFKSLAVKTDLEIRPLTVLAGANSSGKSSFMQPLLLMKQTLESGFLAAGPFLLVGPYVQFTETKQFLSRTGSLNGRQRVFTLEFDFNQGMTVGMAYATNPEAGISVAETWGSNAVKQSEWRLNEKLTAEELNAMLLKLGSFPQWMTSAGLTESSVQDAGFYQSIVYSVPDSSEHEGLKMKRRELYYMLENLELNAQIGRLIYVSGIRGGQSRKSLFAEVTGHEFFPGPFESYAPSLIYSWQQSRNRPKIGELVEALCALQLASGVSQVRLNESELEIRIPRTRNSADNDFVNIADVGLAVPTALPVLVALIQAVPGQLVYIEQPELHLHPRAQWRLGQLLANAANRGARLVIETHSSLLLRGILTEVAKDRISNDKVILHWFERDNETGLSTVHSAKPDSAGRVGDWPEDFGDVELGSDNDYLNAVEGKLTAAKK